MKFFYHEMLINCVYNFVLFSILVLHFGGSTRPVIFLNDSLVRYERDVGIKYLLFPEGSNFQVVYCLTLSTYAKPQGMCSIGITAGLAWELPHRNTVPYRNPAEVYHRRSRRELYRKVELMLRTQEKDGRACVLKAICEAARRKRESIGEGSFVEEILHAIFTLPGGWYDIDPMTEYERTYHLSENCDEMRAKCPDVF